MGEFEEWELAERAKDYIELYAKPGDTVCYIPYRDVPTQSEKHVKFVYVEAVGWVYADNSQDSGVG
jgi:hypothetical protein